MIMESGKEIEQLNKSNVMTTWSKQTKTPMAIKEAKGIYIYDYDGNKYADMSSQLVCANLGHGNEEVAEAIAEQAKRFCYTAASYATDVKAILADKIIKLAGEEDFDKIYFVSGGSTANDNAIKIARMVTGRNKIFSSYRSYHGSTIGAGSMSGDWRRFYVESPGSAGFVHFFGPYMYQDNFQDGEDEKATAYYIDLLKKQLMYEGPQNVAAIFVECIVGGNGVILPSAGYLKEVREICTKHGILMICDEVMSGFYRAGKPFSFNLYDIVPDMFTFAKGVNGASVPLGGVAMNHSITSYFDENVFQCGITYSGHTLACAAGVAVLEYYEKHDIETHVNEVGALMGEYLDKMAEEHPIVGQARHIGLFGALELVKDKENRVPLVEYSVANDIMPAIIGKLKEKGFATYGRENNIQVCPPLIITKEEVAETMAILDEVLTWADATYLEV